MSQNSSIFFTEEMHGFIGNSSQVSDYSPKILESSYLQGKSLNQSFKFRVTVYIDHIDDFLNDPKLEAKLTGYIESPLFGGRREIEKGVFNLFVYPDESTEFNAAKEMHYAFQFNGTDGKTYFFKGFKII